MARRGPGRPRKKRYYYQGEELPRLELKPETKRGILIVLFAVLGLVSLLSFFDAAGVAGEIVKKVFTLLLGWAALAAPLIFFAMALAFFLAGRREAEADEEAPVGNARIYIGGILFTVGLTGLLHIIAMRPDSGRVFELVKAGAGGGYLGLLSAYPLFALADFWVSILIMAALLITAMILLFNLSFSGIRQLALKSRERERDIKINKMQTSGFNLQRVDADGDAEEEIAVEQEIFDETLAEADEAKPVDYERVTARFRKGNWQLPPISLLEDSHSVVDSGNIEANVTIIQKTLQDFGIEVEMGEVNVGPTVTQYTLRPAHGIKLSQIVALQNDLALALAAPSIRIEAPIPGRALVGVEVPNKATAIVRIKDIISTESFIAHKSPLAFSLGRDVAGMPMIADLARMPHLLIAGATGAGKSIAINSMLISFLFRNSPEELRLIVIDPKRVELNLYNGIPHLLTPVVTDHNKAVNALRWAVAEMDRRYNLLAAANRRNITEYNSKAPEPLPYIVIIVDELADLMAVAQADVEAAVVRLAQMARAVGVHLVLATQRPSVDIITGLIKANITARMAFAVASQVDSRTILDIGGAEKLLGAGDMLYVTSDLGKPKRIQGTYISEKEVSGVVDFVKNQAGEVEYAEGILEKQSARGAAAFSGEADEDELLPEAITVVARAGKASASLLQRRLRLGYARAARLLDLMEARGLIGPADGAKPREVYVDRRYADGADNTDEEI